MNTPCSHQRILVSGMLACLVVYFGILLSLRTLDKLVPGVLLVSLVALTVALGLGFLVAGIVGASRSWLLAALCVVVYGLGTGYLGAWTTFCEESTGHAPWYSILVLPGLVGDIVTESLLHEGDWGIHEAWAYRHQIAVCNAVVWTPVALAAGALVRVGLKHGLLGTRSKFPGPRIEIAGSGPPCAGG